MLLPQKLFVNYSKLSVAVFFALPADEFSPTSTSCSLLYAYCMVAFQWVDVPIWRPCIFRTMDPSALFMAALQSIPCTGLPFQVFFHPLREFSRCRFYRTPSGLSSAQSAFCRLFSQPLGLNNRRFGFGCRRRNTLIVFSQVAYRLTIT